MAVKHGVNKDEIEQCFANRTGPYLEDTRADHLTDPITLWFIAETNFGRLLKIVFIDKNTDLHIRTAYSPNIQELCIYNSHKDVN